MYIKVTLPYYGHNSAVIFQYHNEFFSKQTWCPPPPPLGQIFQNLRHLCSIKIKNGNFAHHCNTAYSKTKVI